MPFLFAILGICFGSFASVLIERLPRNESFIFARSRCPKCRSKLSALELIPIFSQIALKGKCKHCGKTISAIYPLCEISLGVLGLFAYFIAPSLILALLLLIIFTIFYALSVIDFKFKAVPNGLLMSGYFLSVIYAFLSDISNIIDSFIIIGVMIILKSILMLRHSFKGKTIEPMGDADSIFIASMVAILGLELGFVALFAGSLLQLILHIIKKDRAIAFIPSLFAGFIAILAVKNFINLNLGSI